MRLYVEIARRSFQRHLAYRSATLAGLFTNSVFGALLAAVYLALYNGQDNTRVAGFSAQEAVTFVWIGQSLIMVVNLWGWWEVATAIKTGDIVADLLKPFDYFTYWLSRDVGRAACHVLTRCIPTFLIGGLLADLLLPGSLGRWLAFVLSVSMAVVVSFGWRFLLNLSAFWLLDVRGVVAFSLVFVNFFSGLLVPLAFFPPWVLTVANLLPFRAIVMVPIEVLLGQRDLLSAFAIQLFWIVALTASAKRVMALAIRKVVVQGG